MCSLSTVVALRTRFQLPAPRCRLNTALSLRAPSGVRRLQEFDVTPLLPSFLSFFQSEAKFEFGGKEDFLHLSKLQAKWKKTLRVMVKK